MGRDNIKTTAENFWHKVDTSGECWAWKGTRNEGGYGTVSFDGRPTAAHRLAFQFAVGPIPEGRMICHRCNNPPCVRPSHLYVGTALDNAGDRWRRERGAEVRQ